MICARLTVTLISFGIFAISASPVPQTVEIQNLDDSSNFAAVFKSNRQKREESRQLLCAPSVKNLSVKELERVIIDVDPSKSKAEIDELNKNLKVAASLYRKILAEDDFTVRVEKCNFDDEIGPAGQKQICVQKYTQMTIGDIVFEYPSYCKTINDM